MKKEEVRIIDFDENNNIRKYKFGGEITKEGIEKFVTLYEEGNLEKY